jgi:NAD(P)-dependent dehydrogenase (short-subunit alcohol dehydrogenase family)
MFMHDVKASLLSSYPFQLSRIQESIRCADGQSNVDSGVLSPYTGYAGRYATPEEMAWPLLFLNSDLASYISGALLPADFGAGMEILAGLRNSPIGDTIAYRSPDLV